MNSVNVSLTSEQVKLVDSLTSIYGYANRSEFFRAILRLVAQKPKVLRDSDELILESPDTKDSNKIIADMKATGLYNAKFLASLKRGMDESNYFKD